MAEQFKWVSFYMEFATKLLEYKADRVSLIEKLQNVYSGTGMKLPKLEKDNVPKDIDPFTTFGLFNKGITDAKRISILGGIKSLFGIEADVPDDFSGIPVLNNMMATFYAFEGDDRRKDDDIDNLWNTFEAAVRLAENDSEESRTAFSLAYDKAKAQFAVRWNLSMGLYWIRPYTFINLDSRNREFMSNPDNISANVVAEMKTLKSVPSAEKYLSICDKCRSAIESGEYSYTSFPELSYKAWIVSIAKSEMEKVARTGKSNAAFLRWFSPIIRALRDLGGSATPEETRKRIIENEKLTDEEVNATRGKNHVNKFENEVAFARSYLVKAGYIDNKVYGI
jgi:5-methylcytosine-specific restriction protein B